MDRKKTASILTFCGACISFYIGAGFATMQEVVQYEASYGTLFPVVILVVATIYIYTNISFATNGSYYGIKRGGDIYKLYCSALGEKAGNALAKFFDYFSAFFCYMSFVVMCGGANSTLMQQWGLPAGLGAILLTTLVVVTVFFGLDGILNALSKIGPAIIIMILLVSSFTAVTGSGDFISNLHEIDSGKYTDVIEQVGNGNPIASGASYGGFVILWFASFLSEIGGKNRLKEVNTGMLLSALFIFGASTICCIALIGHVGLIATSDIPALVLANQISPVVAFVFALIICAGIYTSATPLLWTAVRKISEEGTVGYKATTVITGIIGCIIACFVPYKGLINILYGVNGYLGFVLMGIMIFHDVHAIRKRKCSHE